MKRLKAILDGIHRWLESIARRGAPYVERVLGRLPSREEIEVVDFATDADLAMLRQEPLRARVLLRSIGVVFAGRCRTTG
jgi:adhesin transport system membrane fusion protein